MDELIGAFLVAILYKILAVMAVIFLPFVALGQIVFELVFARERHPEKAWQRKTVFRLYRDSIREVVIVYGVAALSLVTTFWLAFGAPLGEGRRLFAAAETPPIVAEPEQGEVQRLLERVLRRGDEEIAKPTDEPGTRPFWKFWERD